MALGTTRLTTEMTIGKLLSALDEIDNGDTTRPEVCTALDVFAVRGVWFDEGNEIVRVQTSTNNADGLTHAELHAKLLALVTSGAPGITFATPVKLGTGALLRLSVYGVRNDTLMLQWK